MNVSHNNRTKLYKLTSAHALGRTRRPIRPASLALRTFSNNGTMVEFELDHSKVKDITIQHKGQEIIKV